VTSMSPAQFDIVPDDIAGKTLAAPGDKAVLSLDAVILNYRREHISWPTNGSVVNYAFMTSAPADVDPGVAFQPLTAIEKTLTRLAFQQFAEIINLTFAEVPADSGASQLIQFATDGNAPDFEWGHTSYRYGFSGGDNVLRSAQIWISTDAAAVRQWVVGGYNFQALMHEVGHALGAPHPGDYNANGSPITYAADATYLQDSRQYTIMSYFDASNTGADSVLDSTGLSYSAATPLLHDIAALQAMYGANMTTRTGDTVYGYNSNAANSAFDFTVNVAGIVSIWDAGGVDTLDLSGSSLAARLDLNEGAFSDALSLTKNISIAFGAKIENAKGGSAGDSLTGNALANVLSGLGGDDTFTGGAGNDTLDGGTGTDKATYAATAKDYNWWSNAGGTWTVQDVRAGGPDGVDTLVSIETLQFSDRGVKLTGLTVGETLSTAFQNVLRYTAVSATDTGFLSTLTSQVSGGQLTQAQAFAQIADRADGTTAVAALSYQFFVGTTPSKGGLDYLIAPDSGNANNLNSAYYQSFNLENRFINFAVNLGKAGEGRAAFEAAYGTSSLFDTGRAVYAKIFGITPTDDKLHAILDAPVAGGARADYFHYYGQDDIGAKAAMVGWLLAEAEKADIGFYARSGDAFLLDLADGAKLQIDLIGVYNQPSFALMN
jgi:serralysin